MGLIKPDIGKVVLNQEEITNLPMYRRAQKGFRLFATRIFNI